MTSTAEKVAFLQRPSSYPDGAGQVATIQTHMSWVFLTQRFVYKMKKPIRRPYLDFSSLESRRYCCLESLRLNRRLAPHVYLDVVPLTREGAGHLEINGAGEVVEWLEKMVRLPAERMLDAVIEQHPAPAGEAAPAARLLGAFYRDQPGVAYPHHRQRLRYDVRENAAALATPRYRLERDQVERLAGALLRTLDQAAEVFQARLDGGRVVEGHGDLRPEHVCLTDTPVVIDCLEFNHELRVVDAVDELAYLALETERLGHDLHDLLFDAYRAATADDPSEMVVSFYKVHRAMLRAKLAVWHLDDPEVHDHETWLGKAGAYLALAERHAERMIRTLR